MKVGSVKLTLQILTYTLRKLRPLWFILFPNNNYLSCVLFPSAVHLVLPGHKQHVLN